MKINFVSKTHSAKGTLVVFGFEDSKLSASAKKIDETMSGLLSRAMEVHNYSGKFGEAVEVIAPQKAKVNRVLLMGLGKAADMTEVAAEKLGGKIIARYVSSGEENITLAVDPLPKSGLSAEGFAAHLAFGIMLRRYRFDKYFTKQPESKKPSVRAVHVMSAVTKKAEAAFAILEKIGDGVIFARDLVTEPGNAVYPESYVEHIRELEKLGVDVEVLDEDQMEELGMDALLGVGQGSACQSFLVIMRWNGLENKRTKPVAFVGKGVTFDTGGISLKPGAGMGDMKFDMGGSAAVVGAMKALAGRKAKANVVGVVGLVENMPSSTAQRPGDVVTSMSGQTIEILNTDAEGRLVLADALWYTQDRFKPKCMIDLATLTGAMLVALGQEFAGLFSNSDLLCDQLLAAGKSVDELVWRMPLTPGFDEMINSDIADMKNIGGKYGGSITAGQFLQRYVNDVPWVHIDIAGTAWRQKSSDVAEKGATGYGVRLLDRFISDNYEK